MLERLPRVGPRAYARIATAAFVLLALIVFTGAAVRLTGSGLGCPTWPRCHGHLVTTELDLHGAIEYGNRLITGLVGVVAIAAALLAFLRRPFRRDLESGDELRNVIVNRLRPKLSSPGDWGPIVAAHDHVLSNRAGALRPGRHPVLGNVRQA